MCESRLRLCKLTNVGAEERPPSPPTPLPPEVGGRGESNVRCQFGGVRENTCERIMGIAGSLMVISIAWWLAFFAMLPFGVRSQIEDGNVAPGTEPSAPTAPRLWRKAVWALVIALIAWGGLFWLVEFSGVTVDDIPIPSGIRWN